MQFEDFEQKLDQIAGGADLTVFIDEMDAWLGSYNRDGGWKEGLAQCRKAEELLEERLREADTGDQARECGNVPGAQEMNTILQILRNIDFFYCCCARTGAEAVRNDVEFMWTFLSGRREWNSRGVLGWIGAFYDDFFNGRIAEPRQYNEESYLHPIN